MTDNDKECFMAYKEYVHVLIGMYHSSLQMNSNLLYCFVVVIALLCGCSKELSFRLLLFLSMLLLALLAVSSVFLLTTKHFSFDLEEWFDQDTEQDAPPFLGSLPGKVTYSGTPFSASSRN